MILEGTNWKIGNAFIYNEMLSSAHHLLNVIVWIALIGILLSVVLTIFSQESLRIRFAA